MSKMDQGAYGTGKTIEKSTRNFIATNEQKGIGLTKLLSFNPSHFSRKVK